MRKCIYAYTPAGGPHPPPYFNVTDTGDGEHVEVIVRDHPQLVEHESGASLDQGHTTTLTMHRDRAIELARAIMDTFCRAPKSGRTPVDVAKLVSGLSAGNGRLDTHPIHAGIRNMEIVGDGLRVS